MKTYLLFCRGQRYSGVTLEEAKRILIDVGGYSYAHVKNLLEKAARERMAEAVKEIRQLSHEEFMQWLGSKKCGSARNGVSCVESVGQSLGSANTAQETKPDKRP
jgi:hypothetical protein